MANELTVSSSIRFQKGNAPAVRFEQTPTDLNVSGTQCVVHIQSIGTSEEALDIGDLGTLGWAYFHNLDATNFVSIRSGTGAANFLKLLPGERAGPMRLAASAPYAIADTGACELWYMIVEA